MINAFVAFIIKMFEDILIIHFTSSRFIPARVVTNLEIGNLVPALINIADNIPFIALHVIHIEEDLAGGAANRLADHIGLV